MGARNNMSVFDDIRERVTDTFGTICDRLAAIRENLGHHATVFRAAWAEEKEKDKTQGKAETRIRDEMAFLPARLEVMETPASPLGRVIALSIAAFLIITIVWAVFGKLDIIATAQGKIIPSERIKVIQPVEAGSIRAIHVTDGQRVKKGEVLIELNTTETNADKDRLSQELMATRVATARLNALLEENPEDSFAPPKGASTSLVAVQRAYLMGQWGEHRSELAALGSDAAKQRAELRTTQARIDRLEKLLPLVRERVESKRKLAKKDFLPRMAFVELEEELIDQEGQLDIERQQLDESQQTLQATQARKAQVVAKFRHEVLATLAETSEKAHSIEQELIKATDRSDRQTLIAPVDGVVQQLAVHTIGGVVTPAQELMTVVPADTKLEIEAMVLNKDIGFVHDGQTVEIKVDSFPFTKFGTIDGKVLHVSRDSIQDEQLGLVYPARVHMDRTTILVGDKNVNLGPGMSLTIEIKTGKRRLIEYLLAPLQEYQDESLRER